MLTVSIALAGDSLLAQTGPADATSSADQQAYESAVQPLLKKLCWRCHGAEEMESGIRVDQLNATPADRQIFLLNDIRKQLLEGAMPPPEELQPTAEERQQLTEWIMKTVAAARSRQTQKNGSIRRLTVAQYRNTLKELLDLQEDLTDTLPPDGTSKEGFNNQAHTLVLSPLQVETYLNIAEEALNLSIVDESAKPVIQTFRMDFGKAINKQPCLDSLVLGANSALLNNADFVVTELQPAKPFAYQPFAMQTKFNFIEGYVGNDTIREWKKFDSIYHAVFACVRGMPGYPKGEAHTVVPAGLLLRPSVPSREIFGQSDTYGPQANFKISLRELPEHGNFRVTVKAARYDDGLLLDGQRPVENPVESSTVRIADLSKPEPVRIDIEQAGIYQVDLYSQLKENSDTLRLSLGDREFSKVANSALQSWVLVRLEAGALSISAKGTQGSTAVQRVVLSRVAEDSDLGRRFQTFEQRSPSVGVHVGLRRDCGSTLAPVGSPCRVNGRDVESYVFQGAIRDYPSPDVEKDNVNYLAGIREIGVRSEYTDGRDMPRLLIKSVEFEGPYYESWPPPSHRQIFIESTHRDQPAEYAREILRSFASRAFRRPVSTDEEDALVAIWQKSFAQQPLSDSSTGDDSTRRKRHFQHSIRDALLVVLTSPQFLFLIETSRGPEAENLDGYELASKLSYFLWNSPPDQRLLDLAAGNALHPSLDSEIDRLIAAPQFGLFLQEFGSQWLSLDKFDVVATDAKLYPRLARDTKTELRREPIELLRHLVQQNLPVRNIVQADFIVANEVVASYYDLGSTTELGFQFEAIPHRKENLGGVLTQASILAGLSDGRESNPIKRGAWLARKIIAEPPDDPPPNVPKLPEDDGSKLTLRQKLERHRNQKGCVKCHSGIDPWGIPFESFDAGGLLKSTPGIDPHSTLPDGTEVKDLAQLKNYLAHDRIDQVAFSFMKHLATYAVGRSLTYNEIVFLQENGKKLKSTDYRLRDMMKFIVNSELFLKK